MILVKVITNIHEKNNLHESSEIKLSWPVRGTEIAYKKKFYQNEGYFFVS